LGRARRSEWPLVRRLCRSAEGRCEPIVTNAAGCIDDRKLRKADIAFGKVGPSRSLTLGLYINAQLHQTGRSRPQFLVTRESFYSNRLLVPPPGKLRTVSQSNVNKDTCDMCAHAKVNDCAADPPPLNWSALIVRKRRIKNGNQTTQARRDCHEVTAG